VAQGVLVHVGDAVGGRKPDRCTVEMDPPGPPPDWCGGARVLVVPIPVEPAFSFEVWASGCIMRLQEELLAQARRHHDALRSDTDKLRKAYDALRFYVDASREELGERRWTRNDALRVARELEPTDVP
jgi:hypothetical protein